MEDKCIVKYSHALDGMACMGTYIKKELICTHVEFVQCINNFIQEQEAKKCEETK